MKKHVIVAGAGASGLMAAIFAARSGAKVTILESMDRPGKKLLITGNGRCNLTNMEEHLPNRYHGAGSTLAAKVISSFDAKKTRDFFRELGLWTIERNGYVYPLTNQASSVLDVLLLELRRLGIRLKLTEKITAVERGSGGWQVHTKTWTYQADRVILCCGSRCAPNTGSDGSGYQLAQALGLKINRVVPALVPMCCRDTAPAALAGVRSQGRVSLYRTYSDFPDKKKLPGKGASADRLRQELQNSELLGAESGEIQWTKYGISGIAVFQLSRFVSLSKGKDHFIASLDLLSSGSEETTRAFLKARIDVIPNERAASLFFGLLHEKLIPVILDRASIGTKRTCASLSEEELDKLIFICHHFLLEVTGTKDFDTAQVCAGGIDPSELDSNTLECKKHPGLYIAGELIDADGPCGGYNLQWAWASGALAGRLAASR